MGNDTVNPNKEVTPVVYSEEGVDKALEDRKIQDWNETSKIGGIQTGVSSVTGGKDYSLSTDQKKRLVDAGANMTDFEKNYYEKQKPLNFFYSQDHKAGAMIGCWVPEKLQGKTGQTVKNNAEKERRQRGLPFFLPFPGYERRNETGDQEVQLHRVYR